jgi:hypothetical protein
MRSHRRAAIEPDSAATLKFVSDRPFADPDAAARKLMKLANAFEPVQDGRIYIQKISGPFIYEPKGTPAEYRAGLISQSPDGCLWLHESGSYVRLTEAGSRAGSYPHSTNSD